MDIAIFPNSLKPESKAVALHISRFLRNRGVKVIAEDFEAEELEAFPLSQTPLSSIKFLISVGGDGTILRLIHRHPELNAPLLGINLGGLGFLADTPIAEVDLSLEDLLSGNYEIQERMMMEGFLNGDYCFAVNEISIHRAQIPSLIDLDIYVDGSYLNTFSADGIIIATPTGSTAYSLASGGPIVAPDLNVFVLTPICPHTISNRPVVFMPSKNIEIKYTGSQYAEISYDGFSHFNLQSQQTLTIKKSKKKFLWINLNRHDYFSTLRTKLGWSGKLREIN